MLPELCALLLTGLLAAGDTSLPPEAADMETLEFLGSFETKDGQWLDPLSLDDRTPEKPKPGHEEKPHE